MPDIPLPGTEASTFIINGSSTNWVHPLEDCVYNYLYDRWNEDHPAKEDLAEINRSYDGVGWAHFWLQRGQTNIQRDTIDGQFWNGQTNLQINCLMKRLSKGQLDDTLDNIIKECRRSLIEYQPHWIAGVYEFNDFNEVPLVYGPDDERNPYQNTWVALVTVNTFYRIQTLFNISSLDAYEPAKWTAGDLTYK